MKDWAKFECLILRLKNSVRSLLVQKQKWKRSCWKRLVLVEKADDVIGDEGYQEKEEEDDDDNDDDESEAKEMHIELK